MATLNKIPAEIMVRHGANAATDVTGFGILGHGSEIADGSNVTLKLNFNRIPILENAISYAEQGCLTGGASANKDYLENRVKLAANLSKAQIDVLYDAQTSGGLLMAFAPEDAEDFKADAQSAGLDVFEIGVVAARDKFSIIVE